MLNITAETGSKAPKMAVGVDPINWIARVVHANDNTVGIIAKAPKDTQPTDFVGKVRSKPNGIRNRYRNVPLLNT